MKDKVFLIGEENNSDLTYSTLKNFDYMVNMDYKDLLSGKEVIASDAALFITFPYSLWGNMVETGKFLYGLEEFGDAIKNMSNHLEAALERRFPGAKYINAPDSLRKERDKVYVKDIVRKNGLSVVEDLYGSNEPKSVDKLLDVVENGEKIYVKVRHGSMGKGITYISPEKWMTNFKYENGTIKNHDCHNDVWPSTNVTGNVAFLEELLSKDVVAEYAVQNAITNGYKFDTRAVVLFGEVDDELIYGRGTHDSHITNLTQGSKKMEYSELINILPEKKLHEAIELIKHSAELLNLNYAGGDVLFKGKEFDPVFLEVNSFPGALGNGKKVFPKLYDGIKNYFNK